MDLVQTVRKEGTRGGRGEFKWEDVKNSSHRENYLGHSVMAPVGRWQQNKDLSWYAKGEGENQKTEAEIRKEEIKRIKEAEEDAMARALGYGVPPRPAPGTENPNLTALGGEDKMKAIQTGKDATKDENLEKESLEKEERRRHRKRDDKDRHSRRRERSRERDEKHRHRRRDERESDRPRPDGSKDRSRERRRSRSRDRHRDRDDRGRRHDDNSVRRRSRSPYGEYERSRHRH